MNELRPARLVTESSVLEERDWDRMSRLERSAAARRSVASGESVAVFRQRMGVRPRTADFAKAGKYWFEAQRSAESDRARKAIIAAASRGEIGPPILIHELDSNRCRWPMWDHDCRAPGPYEATYCGGPTIAEWPYCADHARIATRTVVDRDPETYINYKARK